MPYSLKQAAVATGKSKTAILRAIQGGKVSAGRDEHGQWVIDPAEVHRVYPPVNLDGARSIAPGAQESALEVEVRMLREMVADQRTMIEGLENMVSDLQGRLDQEAADRRRAYAQLTGLLTDQRSPPAETARQRLRWLGLGRLRGR